MYLEVEIQQGSPNQYKANKVIIFREYKATCNVRLMLVEVKVQQ